jgi:hypothetical protein
LVKQGWNDRINIAVDSDSKGTVNIMSTEPLSGNSTHTVKCTLTGCDLGGSTPCNASCNAADGVTVSILPASDCSVANHLLRLSDHGLVSESCILPWLDMQDPMAFIVEWSGGSGGGDSYTLECNGP